MASFSISRAAFTGLRIVRERPAAFGVWLLINVGLGLVGTTAMISVMGPRIAQMQAMTAAGAAANPAAALAIWRMLGPLFVLQFVVFLAYYAIGYATIDRAVLRPSETRFAYLRLGSDELRQLGLMLLIFAVGIGAYIAFLIVGVIVGTIGFLVLRSLSPALGGLAIFVGFLAALCGFIFVGTRLSLASAITFATRRVDLFSSWSLTRGKFWPMFATYLVAWLLMILIYVVGLALISAVVAIMGAGNIAAFMFRPDMRSLSAFVTPARITYLALSGVLTTLIFPTLIGPSATIYKSLSAPLDGVIGEQESIETIFS
jgi:hypothetical protein